MAAPLRWRTRQPSCFATAWLTFTGAPARYELCAGCLDTRWYSELGIPAFWFGPGRFDVSHCPNEYVEEAALRRVAAIYSLYGARLLARQ